MISSFSAVNCRNSMISYTFTNMPALIVVEIVVVALQGYFFLQVHPQHSNTSAASNLTPHMRHVTRHTQVILDILKLRRLFFREIQNIISFVYNVILTACIVGRMQCQFISSAFTPASSDKETFVSMQGMIGLQSNLRSFSAVCLWCCFFMIGCRILFLQPEVNQRFNRVLKSSIIDVLVGIVFIIIIFIASGSAIQILFGNRLEHFSSLHDSVLFQLHSIFGSMSVFEQTPYGLAASQRYTQLLLLCDWSPSNSLQNVTLSCFRFNSREKGELIVFVVLSLILFFTLVVGVFVRFASHISHSINTS